MPVADTLGYNGYHVTEALESCPPWRTGDVGPGCARGGRGGVAVPGKLADVVVLRGASIVVPDTNRDVGSHGNTCRFLIS